jgi:ABC-2 type transport system ATP-binding protein
VSAASIEIEGLTVHRGVRDVVRGLSVTVQAGCVTGLFGPSGSGKSTLIRSIAGVQANVQGRVKVMGAQPGARAVRRELGYMTQAPSVYEDMTVTENVTYFARLRAVDPAGVLARVGLDAEADQLVRNLSGGQRARVSLAVALVGRPRLLLLDEPTVGLDPLLRRQLWHVFSGLAREGAALLVSSHVLDEARHCDQLILLRDGELVAQLTPVELVRRTGTEDMDEAFVRLIESR